MRKRLTFLIWLVQSRLVSLIWQVEAALRKEIDEVRVQLEGSSTTSQTMTIRLEELAESNSKCQLSSELGPT